MTVTVAGLVRDAQVLVCCGAGGVGKTTVATALALAGARRGRRVLALTVDPSRRLSETLGVDRNLREPVAVPADLQRRAGIAPPGSLDTWMLSPQLVADRVVRRYATSEEMRARLMGNRIYQQVTRMVAGMQEYTAMEAVHDFVRQGRYDLIVLDTPPSRNALDFLDGPRRLQRFFDGRIFRLFLPGEGTSVIGRAARSLIRRVLTAAFGRDNVDELQEFFSLFGELFGLLTSNAVRTRALLSDAERSGFLLVTTPASPAVTDAMVFRRTTEEMGLPFRGFVLNRSHAPREGRRMPDEMLFTPPLSGARRTALAKLVELAELERAEMLRDRALLGELAERAGEAAFARALPTIPGGVDDVEAVLHLAGALMAAEDDAG